MEGPTAELKNKFITIPGSLIVTLFVAVQPFSPLVAKLF
jgi:hypothetical protein